MNSQKYKIQALIAEIDEVLSKPAPRLPWTGSIDTVHQRQLLERVRTYLVSSESKVAARKGPASPTVRPEPVPVPKMPPRIDRPSVTEQIMLAVTEEITNLRSGLTGPLQEEIVALRQEQQALIQEIKQLEAKRQQQQSLAQQQANQQQIISEFLQVLTGRLEETLDRDLSQIFGSLENQLLPSTAAQSQQSALSAQTSEELPLLTPAQRLEQMQRFQASADSLLMRLDSTMGIVFEALEANLQSYQASLSQGLENMHGLSQQSEAMFATFVNHLVAQLGREASSYVQQPIALANVQTGSPTASDRSVATGGFSNTKIHSSADAESEERSGELPEQDRLPYAGTEISSQFGKLRRDRDRIETPLSLPDLEDNLFGSSPEIPPQPTRFSGADSENFLAENDENVEDLYASLFAGETVAELELELEDFTIENTESAAATEAVLSPSVAERETTEPLNSAEDLFANLLDEGESLEDVLADEDSEFAIGNSVEALTLDTEDLFEPQVTTVAEVSAPSALSSIEPQLELDDRENLEMAQNLGEHFDTAAVPGPRPEQGPPTASAGDRISSNQPRNTRVPSARDVQTGDFGSSSQGLNDVYIQASPEEDLLPVEALEDDLDRALKLDVSTMELLEADLYNLEGSDNNAPRRSTSSASNNLDLLASSPDEGADNPFAEAAEEELGSLEDLFSDELELSSEDEPFVLEDELEDDLFAGEDESNLTLDEILASLKDTDPEVAQTPETEELPSNPPKSQKKNLISRQSKAGVVEEITESREFAVGQQQESALHSVPGAIAPSSSQSQKRPNSLWYLGLDFGSSGLSAALLDRASGQLHPIYWETAQAEVSAASASFRIPSVAAIEETAPTATSGPQVTVKSVGSPQLDLRAGEFLLQNFKLPLKVGIPYQRATGGMYEPLLQWSSDLAVSIALPLHAVRALLATLNRKHQGKKFRTSPEVLDSASPEANSALLPISHLICKASGLTPEILDAALQDLQGVILGTPASWSQAYGFNLREAVLGADLVASGAQIFVVPDAIATLVAAVTPIKNATGVQSAAMDTIESSLAEAAPLTVNASSFSGGTLIVNAGAATVELAVVELQENLQNLTRADFTCQSFDAAGNAFDQDIICQLLAKNETWGMSIDLPRPGHPDLPSRYQLQQRLQGSDFGLQLLEAARHLKVILQHQESCVFDIDQQHWDVKRRDLESLVLVPFVQQLNRELNALLSRAGMSPARINQAICTGGMGGWPAIARWLRQKLPNAIVVQDRELESDRDISEIYNFASNSVFQSTNSSKKSGQVACGLASLALYPQILDVRQQQYSDFFLLWELMQVLGKKTLSFEEILQLLERQGVNTRTCEPRILGILEGRLPAGLLPEEEDFMLLAEESRQNPDWQAILAEPLFFEDVSRGYRLNVEHASVVREYLGKLASSSQQKLLEPLTIAWDIPTDIDRSTVDS
ncbi:MULTISPECIES: hypothetical protein [unclassified Microcoleus]|uniref:hypothetical protein n=1 Tax=unclassified Microcoleus TaxID=2642155 RepID=UPI001D38BA6F|nr:MULTISPECIES: hypothetical protein [unclassified Microcoleus]MCC3473466.1 hypothetical protein [Microcoleus sp. PH2017_13_LAR_U_A]MCC3485824.1 hypothetical protein [Microcoleus sp. PH2017_14_LAR_D_A]